MNYRYTLGPGETKTLDAEGDFFCVVLSPIDLEIAPMRWERALYGQGDKITLPPGQKFTQLNIRNPTAGTVTVIIFVSLGGRYTQQKQSVIEPKTRVIGASDTLTANGTPGDRVDLDPELYLSGADMRRKCIIVSNPDTSLKLELQDENGNGFCVINAGDSVTVPISERCLLVNPNGAPVEYKLGQVIWSV